MKSMRICDDEVSKNEESTCTRIVNFSGELMDQGFDIQVRNLAFCIVGRILMRLLPMYTYIVVVTEECLLCLDRIKCRPCNAPVWKQYDIYKYMYIC